MLCLYLVCTFIFKFEFIFVKTIAIFYKGTSSCFHDKSGVKPNENHFKLIADSVQGLRSFLEGLVTEDSSVPENLISALENLIIQIEPQEYNLIMLNIILK